MSKPSVVTRTLESQETRGFSVVIENVHWRQYCEQVDDLEMPTLDEASFYTASASAFVSLLVALIGVLWGTDNPSNFLIAFLGIGCLAAGVMTLYFRRAYDRAKTRFTQPAKRIARHMREVAEAQTAQPGEAPVPTPAIKGYESRKKPSWYLE
jgi:hypothetical protein